VPRITRHLRDFTELVLPSGCVSCGCWISQVARIGAAGAGHAGGDMVCASCRSGLREPSWPRCPRCAYPRGTGRHDGPDCRACRDWPSALRAARSAVVLRSPASELVHALKYQGWDGLADFMGRRMARAFASDRSADFPSGSRQIVVPVPTTEQRVRERGYNQAALLAERVGRDLRIPVRAGLVRVPGGPSQTALRPEARRENVRGVFRVASASVADAHVLLVDDVLTTGATAGEAATVLHASGAATVVLLTFARALQDLSGG